MQTWSVYNLKGGVGKSSTAVNLAYLAAQSGQHVLLWDLDPQGASTWYFRTEPSLSVKARKLVKGKVPVGRVIRRTLHENLDLIPADFAYRNLDVMLKQGDSDQGLFRQMLQPCGELYSLIIIDCPPSLSRLAETIFVATDALLMPLIPSHLSLRAYEQVRKRLKKLDRSPKQVLPFFSMVDMRRRLHKEWVESPPESLKNPLKTVIPYSAAIEKMGENRAPVEVYAGNSPAAEAYRQLWREVRSRDGELN